jgi:chromosome partitioning protein
MKAIVAASQKGGVGKTTLVLNLGFALARAGWRTLIVDTDPQGAIGHSLSPKVTRAPGLFDVFIQQSTLEDVTIQTRLRELSLVPVGRVGVRQLGWYRSQLAQGVLASVLESTDGRYDVVLLDTPGAIGESTMGVMATSDFVLAPVQAEPIAVRTIPQLLETIGFLRETGSTVRILGFVLTMIALGDPNSEAVVGEFTRLFPNHLTFRTRVPRDPIFLKASSAGVPLGLLSRRVPPAARLFDSLAEEIVSRLELGAVDDGPIPLLD